MINLSHNKATLVYSCAGVLLAAAAAFCIDSILTQPLGFLYGELPERRTRCEGSERSFLFYSFSGDFTEVCQMAKDALQAQGGFRDVTPPGCRPYHRMYETDLGRMKITVTDRDKISRLLGYAASSNANGIGVVELELAHTRSRTKFQRWISNVWLKLIRSNRR